MSTNQPRGVHEDDAAARLWGALRHYQWFVVLFVAFGAAAGAASAVLGNESAKYEASALVIARDVPSRGDARILAEQLPRLGEAVFTGGSVAARAVAQGGLPFTAEDLIPDHAVLEPLEGTIVLRVKGIADEAGLAATTANYVAAAFVDELNRAGPGVGRFAIQDRARTPEQPGADSSLPLLVGTGIVAGLVLALAMVALVMLVRRPVISAADAEDASRAPILATLDLPVPDPQLALGDPRQVVGLGSLVRRMVADNRSVCAFVSTRQGERQRSQLAALVARALLPSGTVALVASSAAVAGRQVGDAPIEVVDGFDSASAAGSAWVVIDGPSNDRLDAAQVLPSSAGIALVVMSGESRAAVEDAVAQLIDDDLLGIVLVRPRSRRWWRRHRTLHAPADQARAVVPRASRSRPPLTRVGDAGHE